MIHTPDISNEKTVPLLWWGVLLMGTMVWLCYNVYKKQRRQRRFSAMKADFINSIPAPLYVPPANNRVTNSRSPEENGPKENISATIRREDAQLQYLINRLLDLNPIEDQ
ncbi:hypothetical protein [Chitinophaga flava]|uniref:Uncharacterized protein n=1 Tax=Chitinophaga flava TaxID=2259036 RepID=A0A365XYD7_9BACT|nr:hypothetical protein [Chitinophaga flava]RBL91399.1 hypothetical protein DF182_01910 [Chitinophaga flava]